MDVDKCQYVILNLLDLLNNRFKSFDRLAVYLKKTLTILDCSVDEWLHLSFQAGLDT